MSVQQYSPKFTQLSCYTPEMVDDIRSKECKETILIGDMDIARIMIHLRQIEEYK